MIAPVPNSSTPLVDGAKAVTPIWFRFFASIGAAPPPAAVVQGKSPLTFKATGPGIFAVQGGAVTALSMMRGEITLPLPAGSALIPVGKEDAVTVTFTAAPTMVFLPS